MAYLILIIGGFYSLYWLLAGMFSMRSTGERSLFIPVTMFVFFLGIAGFGGLKLAEAMSNPAKLTAVNFSQLTKGMTPEQVKATLINKEPEKMHLKSKDMLEKYDLTRNNIIMPADLLVRLPPGKFSADRRDSKLQFSVVGEPSKVNPKIKRGDTKQYLGVAADNGQNGLKGAKLRLFVADPADEKAQQKERAEKKKNAIAEAKKQAEETFAKKNRKATQKEIADAGKAAADKARKDFSLPPLQAKALAGKEWFIEEGKDWTYTDFQTPKQVAEKLREVVDAKKQWKAEIKDIHAKGVISIIGQPAILKTKVKGLKFRMFLPDPAKKKELDDARAKAKEERKKQKEAYKAKKEAAKKKGEEIEKLSFEPFKPLLYPAVSGKEWIVTEGSNWTYKEGQTALQAATALAAYVTSLEGWTAKVQKTDKNNVRVIINPTAKEFLAAAGNQLYAQQLSEPNSKIKVNDDKEGNAYPFFGGIDSTTVIVYPEEQGFLGKAGNKLRMQFMNGPNKSVSVNGTFSGQSRKFNGGADSVRLDFWYEEDPVLDDDFSASPRMLVAGYSAGKLMTAGFTGFVVPDADNKVKYTAASE